MSGWRDEVQQTGAGPGDRGDRGDAEAAVDLGAARVVDAGDDPRHAVVLLGVAGGDDVAVVARGDRREAVGVADAGFLHDVAIEDRADELAAHDLLALVLLERMWVAVDHGHGVSLVLEHVREDSVLRGRILR